MRKLKAGLSKTRFSKSRRKFLRQASAVGLACSTDLLLGSFLSGQTASAKTSVRIYVDTRRAVAPLDRNLFGSFLEVLGRAIYEGVYDPGSKLSDANGFRTDVANEIKKMGVPIVRYPGGNFVSGYNWLDGVGPKQDRPVQLDKAWNSLNSNQFGTNEFMAWCKLVGTEPLMGLNLGTGNAEQAAALVEYCNVDGGTQWSNLRRKHGYNAPYKVEKWCLGNEMDGPWQIGHMPAAEYGLKAADAARQMRYVDPSLKLIACGSSGPFTSTYLEWDREVLEECYDYVDALSLHRYFENNQEATGGDSRKFLAMNLSMEQQIRETLAVCDMVGGRRHSSKKLWLSFDEWNVWYRARSGNDVNGNRKAAPHLLEEVYNLEDALLVGGLLNTLMRNADRIRIACLAQLVNVIAPITTNANGLMRHTIYYPYGWALQYARGRVLDVLVESPTYEVSKTGRVPILTPVPYVDVAGTVNPSDGMVSLFALNRDLENAHEVEINWEEKVPGRLLTASVLTGNDLKAFNTFDAPTRVAPQPFEKPSTSDGRTVVQLPPRSYSVMQWSA